MSRTLHLLCCFGIFIISFVDHAVARSARIQGRTYATEGQFPYQISLQFNGKNECGGSILTKRFVITAAHCVIDGTNKFKSLSPYIVAGVSNLNSKSKSRVEIGVLKVYVLKEYKRTMLGNAVVPPGDIAILELKNDLDFERNSNLGKVKLPENDHDNFEGKNAIISGFGANKIRLIYDYTARKFVGNGSENDYKLRVVKANVLSKEACEHSQGGTVQIPAYELCAAVIPRNKREPEGVCLGDSGGGLIYNGKIIGILSRCPYDCRENLYPAIYTRVSHYLSFINKVLRGTIDNSIRTYTYGISPFFFH